MAGPIFHACGGIEGQCKGWLTMSIGADGMAERSYFVTLNGPIACYFEKDGGLLLGIIAVANCVGKVSGLNIELVGDDFSCSITVASGGNRDFDDHVPYDEMPVIHKPFVSPTFSEELHRWTAPLSAVLKMDESSTEATRPPLMKFSSLRGFEKSVPAGKGADVVVATLQGEENVETAEALHLSSAESRTRMISIAGKHATMLSPSLDTGSSKHAQAAPSALSSLDKMYSWEVNWRKGKVMEDLGMIDPQSLSTARSIESSMLDRMRYRAAIQSKTSGPGAALSSGGSSLNAAASTKETNESERVAREGEENSVPMFTPIVDVSPDCVEIEELVRDSPRFKNVLAEWDREAASMLEAAKRMIKSAESFLRANEEAVSMGQALSSDIAAFGAALTPTPEMLAIFNPPIPPEASNSMVEPPSLSDEGGSNLPEISSENSKKVLMSGKDFRGGFQLVLSEWRFMSQELLILRTVLDEQLQATFVQTLKQYFQSDVRGMRKNKQDYEAVRDRYTSALKRYLSSAAGLSENSKGQLQVELMMLKEKVASVGYVLYQQVVAFRLERHLVLLDTLFYYMSLHTSFFRHGYLSMKHSEGEIDILRQIVQDQRKNVRNRQINIRTAYLEARDRSESRRPEEDMLTTLAAEGSNVRKEGWLLKLSPALQRWKRKWFVLENGKLCYRKDSKTLDTKGNVDMMLTTVKFDTSTPQSSSQGTMGALNLFASKGSKTSGGNRAFTFSVICANPQVEWQIQAESEQDKREWVHAMQTVTANLLGISVPGAPKSEKNDTASGAAQTSTESEMGDGMSLLNTNPSFKCCAECNSPAEWASINLGITLCLECSGAHRSLGVHISKVRSLAMDSWPPHLITFMKMSGNAMNRRIWERGYSAEAYEQQRPSGPGNVALKKNWCERKYATKAWVLKPSNSTSADDDDVLDQAELGLELYTACKDRNLEAVLLLIATGADVNFRCDDDYCRTPLIAALIADVKRLRDGGPFQTVQQESSNDSSDVGIANELTSKELAALDKGGRIDILECLVLNGANLDIQDSHGCTAMHYAAVNEEGSGFMTWLVEHKAKADVSDNLGRTPADLAMIRGNEAGAMAASRHESAGESAGKGTVLESQLGTGRQPSAIVTSLPSEVSEENSIPSSENNEHPFRSRGSSMASRRQRSSLIVLSKDAIGVQTPQQPPPLPDMTAGASWRTKSSTSVNIPPPITVPESQFLKSVPAVNGAPTAPSLTWKGYLDVASGKTYYYNHTTGETTWIVPPDSDIDSRRTSATPNHSSC